jgi:hypothetical protein
MAMSDEIMCSSSEKLVYTNNPVNVLVVKEFDEMGNTALLRSHCLFNMAILQY